MTASRSIRRRAFTLLELIIALSLTCLLAASLFASLYVAFKARQVADRAVSPGRSAELAMEMLRADFDGVQPQRGIFEGTYTGLSNQDDQGNDQAQFYSVADAPQHVDGTGDVSSLESKAVALCAALDLDEGGIGRFIHRYGDFRGPLVLDGDGSLSLPEMQSATRRWRVALAHFELNRT